eukprot:scaffold184780_cov32-Tisochrysis_lutea.AAC.1
MMRVGEAKLELEVHGIDVDPRHVIIVLEQSECNHTRGRVLDVDTGEGVGRAGTFDPKHPPRVAEDPLGRLRVLSVVPALDEHVGHQPDRHPLEVVEAPDEADAAGGEDDVLLHHGHFAIAHHVHGRGGHPRGGRARTASRGRRG